MSDLKFIAAMCSYGILALLAGLTLEGKMRIAVWVFLGGITIKTLLVVLKGRWD
jgi:hypothetical protein